MTYMIDETHDAGLKSWVESANEESADFPIQNLPLGVMKREKDAEPRICVGIGDQVVDLRVCAQLGMFDEGLANAVSSHDLMLVMDLSISQRSLLRKRLSKELSDPQSMLAKPEARQQAMIGQGAVTMCMPCQIGDYTDFYASVFHATNVGSMFRPDNPLLPNYKHIPIGYHGRASSLVPGGTSIRRPCGQLPPSGDGAPTFGPCKNLDYELEVGAFVGRGNRLGERILLGDAESHLFGLCLLNDWSARDMQRWEYQPLGPFLAKSFASSISPWVVTMEALAPFRASAFERPVGDPAPLDYLSCPANEAAGGIDLKLQVFLSSAAMRDQDMAPVQLSEGSFRTMYWTLGQMLAHHTSNGCNLRTGDLLGSGTVSGPARDSRGCLLELTWDGELDRPVPGTQRTPIELPTGEKRVFLEDGDSVMIRGFCERNGYRQIGFGSCDGTILPATC